MASATTLKLSISPRKINFNRLDEATYQKSGLTRVGETQNGGDDVEGSRADIVAFAIEHGLFKAVRENSLEALEITKINCAEIMGHTYRVFTSTTPAIGPNRMENCTTMLAMVTDCLNKLTDTFNEYAQEAGHH